MGKSRTFYKACFYVDEFKVAAGVNLLNHYRSLIAFIKKMSSTKFDSPDSPPFEIVRKSNVITAPKPPVIPGSIKRDENALNWWDKQRMTMHGVLNIKLMRINLDILTHTSPFSEDCLRLSMGMSFFRYQRKEFEFLLKDISVMKLEELGQLRNGTDHLGMKEGETAILQVPQVEILAIIDWNSETDDHYCIIRHLQTSKIQYEEQEKFDSYLDKYISKQLSLQINLNVPKKENSEDQNQFPLTYEDGELGKLVCNSPIPVLHYQTRLFSTLLSLPQLSHDFLMLNGIRLVSYKAIDQAAATQNLMGNKPEGDEHEAAKNTTENSDPDTSRVFDKITPTAAGKQEIMERISKKFVEYEFSEEFANYLDLLTFSLNEQLNVKGRPNIIGWISEVDFRANVTKMRVLMTNVHQKRPVDLRSRQQTKNSPGTANEQYQLCGVQSVIKAIKFKSTFYKKEVN
jgi:hypothetical protein